MTMKKVLYRMANESGPAQSESIIWRKLLDQGVTHRFPNMFAIYMIGLVILVQMAEVERGFSLHLLVKNNLTSRLQVLIMDSLLRVNMHATKDLASVAASDLIAAAVEILNVKPPREGGNPPLMVLRLHERVSKLGEPKILGTLAEKGVVIDPDDDDDGGFFPTDDDGVAQAVEEGPEPITEGMFEALFDNDGLRTCLTMMTGWRWPQSRHRWHRRTGRAYAL
jgi:hypothetical protein